MAPSTGPSSAFESSTFGQTVSIAVDEEIGSASISPCGRDVVLASQSGLRIVDLDNPFSLPLYIPNHFSWKVADVQWSPFAARAEWIASTRNNQALVYNLAMPFNSTKAPIEFTLRAHDRAITDINFSAHHPDLLATCGMDSFVFVHDLRTQQAPLKLADWDAGAHQVKWNRQDDKIIASSHDKYLHIWDTRHATKPISTIDAHKTKIYGIDWSRTDAKKIMTCSLDRTIKLWNNVGVNTNITTPRRTIHTHYPVWRARHTPFPHGILAVPQRDNSKLWLYKHVNDSDPKDFANLPMHILGGHDDGAQVREFLWRSRGSTDNGIDDREFQLVSWGTDNHLRLHRITSDILESVGHRKGDPLVEEPSMTRKGAAYVTYRDGPVQITTSTTSRESGSTYSQQRGNLSTLLQNLSLDDTSYSLPHKRQNTAQTNTDSVTRETMTATSIRRTGPPVVSHMTWMEGVKVGDGHDNADDSLGQPRDREQYPFQERNNLGAEISYVGNKYRKLNFESIDVPGRHITVSFNGPWGEYDSVIEDNKLIFLRLTIGFPVGYPRATKEFDVDGEVIRTGKPLRIDFERTTAAISQENQDELTVNMGYIAEACADQQREALEAVLSYALGERGLNDSLHVDDNEVLADLGPLPGEEFSSDDDDDESAEGEFTNDVMQSSHTNANIPLPNQCSARFSAFGSLVIARLPMTKSASAQEAMIFRIDRSLRHGPGKNDIFNSFGRFNTHHTHDSDGESSSTSSVGSWGDSSSPSSSSGSDHVVNTHIGNFQPPMAWQKAASRFQSRHSLPSSTGANRQAPRPRSIVTILPPALDDLVPSKRTLAEDYRIFGSGPGVCEHNSEVARRLGYEDLADVWMLCKLILSNEVPLEILPQHHRKEQVLVLARRALVRIKRKDSGLDLQFDEADTVTKPKLTGRVKWGNHAVVTWLIPALFDHFERLADTQMLAMLSCIFAEPAAREGVTSTMAKMRHSHLPMSMEAPAFSLDYFSSADAAWSLFKPMISKPSTPAHSRYATPANDFGWQKLAKNLGTYGSHNSSNGPWGSDTAPSEPVTPYSTGHTPPLLSRASTMRSAHTANHTPYSTSPEQSHTTLKKSSTANFASAVAALSRPFANAISSSPPVKSRTDDLSTSAPSSGVTWGTTTFYGSDKIDRRSLAPSRDKHSKRASFGQSERVDVNYFYDSDSEYERIDEPDGVINDGASEYIRPFTPKGDSAETQESIKIKLKNQNQFDDEACVSKPLLNMSKDWLYRAWREQYSEMLGCWGLISAKAEVLKFNGLVSYFPTEITRQMPKSGSMSLAINKDSVEADDSVAKRHTSRASTTLVPPSPRTAQPKHSPAVSPRNFSFNPEAQEFQPGTAAFASVEEYALAPDVGTPIEQCLQLSIHAPTPSRELDEDLGGLESSPTPNQLHPHHNKGPRPRLSRGPSNVSGTSSWGAGRSPSVATTTAPSKPAATDPIYSCSICWIRVCGRVHLCPACLHVAHFDCMDDELGVDDGECVVGCGCGCGLEDDEERSRMEAYLDEVRAANAAGVAWHEDNSEPATPGLFLEGEFMTGAMSKMGGAGEGKRRDRERERVGGRTSKTTSPTPTTSTMRKKKKAPKKPRVSGLSYY